MAVLKVPEMLRPVRLAFLIGVAVFLSCGLLWQLGLFQEPELWFYDYFVRWHSDPAATDPRIVLVEMNEKDIDHLDYPMTDNVLSQVLEKLESGGSNCIGIDLYRDLPEPRSGTQIATFNATLQKYPNIVPIALAVTQKNPGNHPFVIPPPPGLKGDSTRFGLNNFMDGKVIRRAMMLWPLDKNYQGDVYMSLPAQLAQYYLGTHNVDISQVGEALKLGKTIVPILKSNDGGYVKEPLLGYAFMQDYRGPSSFQTFSIIDVLNLKDASVFKDKIVLLGMAADSSNDTFITPLTGKKADGTDARIPGVFIHGQIVNQLLRMAIDGDKPTSSLSQGFGWFLMAVWGIVAVVVGFYVRSHYVFAVIVALSLLLIVYEGWLFYKEGYWILVFAPGVVFITTAGLVKGYAATHEEQERQKLMKLMKQRVNPAVAEEIWKNRETFLLGGRPAPLGLTVTVLFTDLKNYSTISEGMKPEELIPWVNECQGALTRHVEKNNGIVMCFMGDGMMAIFGAPIPRTTEAEKAADAANAVRSAIGMGNEVKQMNRRWKTEGKPLAGLRVGIFTGEAVSGDIGSENYVEYSVIGDTVNTASRLESVDKEGAMTKGELEVRILIGERTFNYIDGQFPARHVGSVKLKGKSETTEVYNVLDSDSEEDQHNNKSL
jgi:adenylate cyclase